MSPKLLKEPSFVIIFNLLVSPVTCNPIKDLSASRSVQLIVDKLLRIFVGRLTGMVSVTRSGDSPQLKETHAYIVTGSDEMLEEREKLATATENVEAAIEEDDCRMPGRMNLRSVHWYSR